jgi:uncharacterized protein (TIGR02001 family)
MRNTFISLSALSLALLSSPAFAADEDVASKELTITGTVAATTDYRFRGISQTNEKFAIQGGATATHSSGLYASFWASSIDDYVAYGADAELDLIAGYSKTIDGFTLDGGVLYYVYASAAKGAKSDFFEPYGSIKYTYGPVTGKAGFAYAWKQNALACGLNCSGGREDNLYLYGELSAAIPDTPFAVSGHLGYTKGRSVLTFGQKNYMDWNITGSYTWKNITVGVTYVDTDIKKKSPYFAGYYDQVDASVLGSVTYAF